MASNKEVRTGEAIGFLDSGDRVDRFKGELSKIERLVNTPSGVHMSFSKNPKGITGDADLKAIGALADQIGLTGVVRASFPGQTNQRAADELAAIGNQAYNSPVYDNGEEFRGEIVYKQGNEYVLR